jgi:acyl-coenzyme A thioesterase PaaI-like protein
MATNATAPASPRPRRWPNCFACGSENQKGLQLHFEITGDGQATANWLASRDYEGFEGMIHGGVIATALDEAMAQAVVASGRNALTCELRVRLRRRIAPGESLHLRGWITGTHKRKLTAEAALSGADGQERAYAWATFLLLSVAAQGV